MSTFTESEYPIARAEALIKETKRIHAMGTRAQVRARATTPTATATVVAPPPPPKKKTLREQADDIWKTGDGNRVVWNCHVCSSPGEVLDWLKHAARK